MRTVFNNLKTSAQLVPTSLQVWNYYYYPYFTYDKPGSQEPHNPRLTKSAHGRADGSQISRAYCDKAKGACLASSTR